MRRRGKGNHGRQIGKPLYVIISTFTRNLCEFPNLSCFFVVLIIKLMCILAGWILAFDEMGWLFVFIFL